MDENNTPPEASASPDTAGDASGGWSDTEPAAAPAGESSDGAEQAPHDGGIFAADGQPAGDMSAETLSSGAGNPAELGAAASDATMAEGAQPAISTPDALQSAADLLEAGGPVVLILLAMSVIAVTITLAKLWQFAGAGLTDRRPVERVLAEVRRGRLAAAGKLAESGRGPAMHALAAALAQGADQNHAREAAWLAATEELESARSWLRPLEVIAGLAPLLGLFGTVLGMIAAFAELEAAGSRVDPSILSGGIWEALLTTAVGLAVAIPALLAFNWFERRIERAESLAERATSALFTAIAPAPASAADRATRPEPEAPAAEGRLHAVAQS